MCIKDILETFTVKRRRVWRSRIREDCDMNNEFSNRVKERLEREGLAIKQVRLKKTKRGYVALADVKSAGFEFTLHIYGDNVKVTVPEYINPEDTWVAHATMVARAALKED